MTIVIIDTETTGLVKDGVTDFLAQPGICQIALKRIPSPGANKAYHKHGIVTAGCDFDEFISLVNPEMTKWEEGAMKVHGLTPEKVKDAPTFFELAPKIAEFFVGATTWAGYNTPFDKKVMWFQLLRYGFEMSFPWPPHEIDVMQMASKRLNLQGKKGQKYPKLVDAYAETFGKNYENAHDALADIRATWALLEKWMKHE